MSDPLERAMHPDRLDDLYVRSVTAKKVDVHELRELVAEVYRLRLLVCSLADRVAAQGELLSRRAEKP